MENLMIVCYKMKPQTVVNKDPDAIWKKFY